ncbi:hypothetical protein LJC68_00295 [Bacteroidales bacterium OttesenSCG-928-B11]|nr:hypothetical protein [Bacteroidales bacterium OttesenSCG-928-C03]MDL2311304.1 hypothetical protein [Bacteroidales bacterium OttesenSCG-928-B11]MDL2326030.1 hypothetical protein [Bacteroidales bacterium OttesenSCG-928-A14]
MEKVEKGSKRKSFSSIPIWFVFCILFFTQKVFSQCSGIPCVILVDGKIPGYQHITDAHFEYQDSIKGLVEIPIRHIYSSLIDIADSNLNKLLQLISEDIYYKNITLSFNLTECVDQPYYKITHKLHYTCSFALNHLLESKNNVISFYNIDKEKSSYFYYFYMGAAIGRSTNADSYVKEKYRVFYNQ